MKFPGQQQGEQRNQQFQCDVGAQGLQRCQPRGHAAAARGAKRQAAEERGDDRAGCGGGVPDVEREETGPADFVDEPGESRAGVCEEEQEGHDRAVYLRGRWAKGAGLLATGSGTTLQRVVSAFRRTGTWWTPGQSMAEDWSPSEVEATVAEYFAMLRKEIAGIP